MRSRLAAARARLARTSGRGRKLRGLAELLAPYRWRVLGMVLSLVAATGAALAPAPLAKLAIDDGIRKHHVGTLDLIVVALGFWTLSLKCVTPSGVAVRVIFTSSGVSCSLTTNASAST